MSNVLLPTLKGLDWTQNLPKKKARFTTLVQEAFATGRTTRVMGAPDPVYDFELSYEFLREANYGSTFNELRRLEAFFNARGGDFDSFLLSLPTLTQNTADGTIAGQALTPDGNAIAPLVVTRDPSLVAYNETIFEAAGVNGNPGVAPVIKKNGVALVLGTDYTIQGPDYVFGSTTYPGLAVVFITSIAGSPIPVFTGDFSWYYRVRFAQSSQEFELFSFLLWQTQQIQLVGERNP